MKNDLGVCPRCGCPDALCVVRERNIDLVLVDKECIDCGFCWSEVRTLAEYKKEVVTSVWV